MSKKSRPEDDSRKNPENNKDGQRRENISDELSSGKFSLDLQAGDQSDSVPVQAVRSGSRTGTLSRRQFLGSISAVAVAAAVGCGDRSPSGVEADGSPDPDDDGGVDADGGIPDKVTGLQRTGSTTTSISMSWNPAQHAETYNIWVDLEPSPRASGITGTNYTLDGLSSDSSYQIRVSGENSSGEGPRSDPVVMRTGEITQPGGGELEDYTPTLWVSTAGSDSNSGTSEESPFLTIQHAVNQANGGDVIQVLAGFYPEQVSVQSRLFSADAPLIIQGEPGVVVDGGYELTNWESVSSISGNYVEDTYRFYAGTGSSEDDLERADWYTVDGRTVYALKYDYSSPHLYFRRDEPPIGHWETIGAMFWKNDGWIYFRHKDGLPPSSFYIRRSRFRSSTILLRDTSHVILRKLKVQTGYYTIHIRDSDHNIVEGCRVFHGDNSIRTSGDSGNNIIRYNYVTQNHIWDDFGGYQTISLLHDRLWSFVKHHGPSNQRGIYFYKVSGSDNLVENNLVYKHWDAFQSHETNGMLEGGLSDSGRENTRGKNVNLVVRNNSFMWSQDSASSIEFGGENFQFYNNRLHEGSNLLRWKGCFIGPTYIFNNIITGRTIQRHDDSYSALSGTYFSPGDMLHTYAHMYMYHNTFAFVSRGLSINPSRGVDGDLVNLTLVNNIFECHYDICSYDPAATEGYSFYGGKRRGSWPDVYHNTNVFEDNNGIPTEHNRIWEVPENSDEIITFDYSLPEGHPTSAAGGNLTQAWSIDGKDFPALPGLPYGSDVSPDMGCVDPQNVGQNFWDYDLTIQEHGTVPGVD